MTDKVIRVNVTSSKSQKVTVSSSKVANEITASPDTSAYYSRLAKNWAIAEGLVENIDYSSKHYAQESKASADMAKTYEISTQENYNMFMEASVNANSELQINRDGALADIEGAKTSAIDSLNSIKDENISTIESKANEALTNIETNRDETLSSIENSRSSSVSEITSLSNGYISQINTTGKSYDNLTHRNITNCLLEVPQRIKLELNNGTLTLKAGSVVIVPYGVTNKTSEFPVGSRFLHDNFKVYDTQFADDKFFVWTELQSDIIGTANTSMGNGLYVFGVKPETNNFSGRLANAQQGSGDGSNIKANDMYYHTGTNAITTYLNGTNEDINCSFPLFLINKDDTGFTSIDQIFNGMGYIGSTVWVDKGVKGLIPNGRNEDGTLKNIEYTTDKVSTMTFTGGYTDSFYLRLAGNDSLTAHSTQIRYNVKSFSEAPTPTVDKWYSVYVEKENNFYYSNNGGKYNLANAVDLSIYSTNNNNQITSFNPKLPFRAIDYSDKSEVGAWSMPSSKYTNLTLGASGTTYTAPANGWVHLRKQSNATNQFIQIWVLEGIGPQIYSSSSTQDLSVYVPVIKGRTFGVNYTANGETKAFKFIYAQGEVS